MVDSVGDPANFVENSLTWVAATLEKPLALPRNDFGGVSEDQWTAALRRGRTTADQRTHGAAPAPHQALQLIELCRLSTLIDAYAAERHALVDLVGTEQFLASAYAFDLVADFIVEAVFEEVDIKKKVFAEMEKHIHPQAVLASNTSSLSITAMAGGLQHPERVVGFHFFNPVAVMPLLEIVRGSATDEHTLATAFALAGTLRKGPILVKDDTGFVVNRLLLRSMGEVFAAIDEGTPALAFRDDSSCAPDRMIPP